MLKRLSLLSVLASLCLSSTATAQYYAPNVDYRGPYFHPFHTGIFTHTVVVLPFATDNWVFDILDFATGTNNSGVQQDGLGFMIASPAVNPDYVTLTTFYGLDQDPGLPVDGALITGFNAIDPEMTFLSETFLGLTEEYPADPLGTFAIGALSSEPLFEDFDFSRFVGDPESIVYAFRATVPLSDFDAVLVPEPSSSILALVGIVLTASACYRRRKR